MTVQRPTSLSPRDKKDAVSGDGAKSQPLISSLRDMVFVATIYLFFVSYVYRYFLLTRLGIPAANDSPPLNVVLATAFEPLLVSWKLVVTVLVVFGVAYVWMRAYAVADKTSTAAQQVDRIAISTLGIALFPMLFGVAWISAREEAASIVRLAVVPRELPVSLSFRPERVGAYGSMLVHAANHDEAYILFRSAESYFVLVHSDSKPTSSFVYEVPKSDISHLRRNLEL